MDTLRVDRISTTQLLLGPVRVALGVVLLALVLAVGTDRGPAGVGFGAGAVALVFLAFTDPRRRFMTPREPPAPLPAGAVEETPAEALRAKVFPSTVGLCVLAGVALGLGEGVLAALLAGALVGMGAAAALTGADLLLQERRRAVALLSDRRRRRFFERPLDS